MAGCRPVLDGGVLLAVASTLMRGCRVAVRGAGVACRWRVFVECEGGYIRACLDDAGLYLLMRSGDCVARCGPGGCRLVHGDPLGCGRVLRAAEAAYSGVVGGAEAREA